MEPQLELVVARYQEDLAWLKRVPAAFRVTVYDKSGDPAYPGAIPLPNLGREAHTYLHHLVSRYDSLADLTVFCQGKPFDHVFDFRHQLNAIAQGETSSQDFDWFGHIVDTDDKRGHRLFLPWSKNPDREELALDEFHRQLWGQEGPDTYTFHLGAQFAVTRELIQRQPLDFYRRALQLSIDFHHAAHCFERTWDKVLGVKGIPREWEGGTVFLKKIRAHNR